MAKPQKIGLFAVVAVGLLTAAICTFILPAKASAIASLYVSPNSGTFTVGSTFTVSIYLNSGGQSINAVQAELSFPPKLLQVVSPTTGKSLVQVWVNQPTYSNLDGTLKFQGTIPTPGINTNAGLISTVTFRVTGLGMAVLRFLDGSQILLNDGLGTDILGQKTDGIYYLTLPPPAGPVTTSPTNPDQSRWYNTKEIVLEWVAPADIQGYSYVLDQDPYDEPDDVSDGTNTRVIYNNMADGVYYFHIKSLRQGAWGGITNYVLNIDTAPPAAFKINFSPGERTSDWRPLIEFSTTDEMSGIDHYELKIVPLDQPLAQAGQNNTPFFIEVQPPYSQELADGRYDVYARAYDKAGNYFQAEGRLTIAPPIFQFFAPGGVQISGFTLPWPYAIILGLLLLALLAFFGYKAWIWHRQLEELMEHGVHRHPAVAPKLEELKKKQDEYGKRGDDPSDPPAARLSGASGAPPAPGVSPASKKFDGKNGAGTGLMVLFLISIFAISTFAGRPARADESAAANVNLEPPVVTLFPNTISNDEILYVGGRAGAPNVKVDVYLQNTDTGSALSEAAVTDKNGAWFYSFPQFLDDGNYIVWTQLESGGVKSAPSPQLNLRVAPTALQFGGNRLSYQDFYLILFIVFFLAFLALLVFIIYHGYHSKVKGQRLAYAVAQAEESIRRGFSVLRRDIESELNLIRRAKISKELSAEEKLREEKLLKDFEDVNRYVGKEIWEIEKEEHRT